MAEVFARIGRELQCRTCQSTVMTYERGKVRVTARHHGEKHTTTETVEDLVDLVFEEKDPMTIEKLLTRVRQRMVEYAAGVEVDSSMVSTTPG